MRARANLNCQSMIPKSGYRFSEKIMLQQCNDETPRDRYLYYRRAIDEATIALGKT
jgi:hypothetical protein